jgi:hypothetical protein
MGPTAEMPAYKLAVLGNLSRVVCEFFMMSNVVFLARLTQGLRDFRPFHYLFIPGETRLEWEIESYIYHRSYPNVRFVPKDPPGHTAFLLATFAIALAGVMILELLPRTSLVRLFLRIVAGLTAVLMLPICLLYAGDSYLHFSESPNPTRPWLYLELAAIGIIVLLYALATQVVPKSILVALILMHQVLWGWLCAGPYFWLVPFLSLVPALSLCASVCWLVHVSRQQPSRTGANTAFDEG